jgi:hypothetical protein
MIIPILFPDVQIPIDKNPAQQGTDLAYIQELARKVGYVFYIEPGPAPGTGCPDGVSRSRRWPSAQAARASATT